jgi:hypothetical protein
MNIINSNLQAIASLLIGVWVIITAYQLHKSVRTLEESQKAGRRKFSYCLFIGGGISIVYAVLAYFGLDDW